ncbi:MAG: hypothetical protein R3F13_03030 [Prosthecobacter sp.]
MIIRDMFSPKMQFSVPGIQCLVGLALATSAFSQATLPSPSLTSISPLGAKPGAKVELTLRGTDLDAPVAVMLNERSIAVSSPKTNVVSLTLPADLKPALYDLRFVGRYGVSNPRVFEISTLDAVASPGTNTKADKAQKVALNSVIEGAFKSTSPHWFVFDGKKGRHVTATFDGHLFDTRTEILGAVSDASGRELARMRAGVLHFDCPADGTYRLRLNDLMFRSGDDYGFRVTLKESAAPPREPADPSAGSVTPIQIGQTIQSTFPAHGAPRVFDLTFKTGDKFIIEVHSHQLGRATDPHLVIENVKKDAAGKETLVAQAEVADAPAITPAPGIAIINRDPLYAYDAKADGVFRLTVNDPFNAGSGKRLPFEIRVVAAPGRPPELIGLNTDLPRATNVRNAVLGLGSVCRGGIHAIQVIAPNRHAFSEPVELKCAHPPAGVTCLGGFIGKGQSVGYLAFQAAADAPLGAIAVPEIAGSDYVSFFVKDSNRENVLTRRTGPPVIGVSSLSSPAVIQTEKTDILEVAADAKLEIALKVTRHADFTDALKLKVLGLIDTAKAPEADIPAKASAGKLTLDVKALKLAPGDYGCILQGPAKMKVRRNLEELTQAETDAKKALGDQKSAQQKLAAANADTTPQKADLVKAATAALKTADAAKAAADKLVKDLTAKAAPKDALFAVYSNPIRIRVKEVAKK